MTRAQTDASVIDACRRGDRAAFEVLFETHRSSIYSIAYHFSGNPDMAKDISQQAFLKIFVALKDFRQDSQLSTWIYRIVANACMDERRSRRRLVPLSDGLNHRSLIEHSRLEDDYYSGQISAEVRDAIADLRPKLRLPIILKYVEELSYEEIARSLGCSMGTVASRLNRGHKALAARLAHLKKSEGLGNHDVDRAR